MLAGRCGGKYRGYVNYYLSTIDYWIQMTKYAMIMMEKYQVMPEFNPGNFCT